MEAKIKMNIAETEGGEVKERMDRRECRKLCERHKKGRLVQLICVPDGSAKINQKKKNILAYMFFWCGSMK